MTTLRRCLAPAAVASVLTFPALALTPGPGTDPSWQAGLVMARLQGLRFGRDVVFTYGPLGFLGHPTLWGTPSVLALALAVLVLGGQVLLGTWWMTRLAPLPLAAASAGLLTALTWRYEPSSITALAYLLAGSTLAFLLTDRIASWRRVVLTAGAAGLLLLAKTDAGTLALVCAAVVPLSGVRRGSGAVGTLGRVGTAGSVWVASVVVGWVIAGQSLGDVCGWLRDAAEVASGFNEAMVWRRPPFGPVTALVALLFFVAVLRGALRRHGLTRRRRVLAFVQTIDVDGRVVDDMSPRRGPGFQTALVLVFTTVVVWLGAKSGFVRYDGHAYRFLWLLLVLGLATALPRASWTDLDARLRRVGVVKRTVALLCFLVLVAATNVPGGGGSLFRFWESPRNVMRALDPLIRTSKRASVMQAGTREILSRDALPPSFADALRSKRVHVESDEIAVIWALDGAAVWDPNPVFQSYSAYTARLDQRNADHYADAVRGPEVVLYQARPGDGHHPRFQSPAAIVSLLCNFAVVPGTDPNWQLLDRVPTRCGTPARRSEIEGRVGEPLQWTPTSDDDAAIVVGRFELDRPALERLSALVRVRPRTWTFTLGPMDGDAIYKFDPGTASQPHLLAVPACLRNQLQQIDTRTYDSVELGLSDDPPRIGVHLVLERIPYRCPAR